MIITTSANFWNELKISENYDVFRDYDALEIGALDGGGTQVFAKHFNRCFVIDPWDGRQQGNQNKYEKWLNNTSIFNNVFHCRTGSETEAAKQFLNNITNLNLGFVFIDGLHTKEGVLNDFQLVLPFCSKNTIILLDDTDYFPVLDGLNEVLRIHKDKIYELNNYAYKNNDGLIDPISKKTFGVK